MIEICVEDSSCYVYNIKDWETLRCKHRIIGELLGNNFCIPSLPLRLLPEEALTLKKKDIGRFVSYPDLKISPTITDSELFNTFKENLIKELKLVYKKIRRSQIENVIDKIVCGKRKRGDVRSKEDIFEEELNKSCNIDNETVLWPIFCHHSHTGEPVEVSESMILAKTTPEKLAIFIDLWEKGYYITTGDKFGGDFLLYLGDPVLYHAVNIIRCVPDTGNFHPTELVAFSRLGTTVKKRTVLAALKSDGIVSYITISWLDT